MMTMLLDVFNTTTLKAGRAVWSERKHLGGIFFVPSGAFLFLMGQGLVGTLTAAEGKSAQFSHFALGIIGSGYYFGFILG